MAGGYVLNSNNMPVYVPVVPVWKQEVDLYGNPVQNGTSEGGCLGKLTVLIIAVVLGFIAAIATLFGGFIIFLYVQLFERSYCDKELKPFSFLDGLVVMYWPMFVCQVASFIFGLILFVMFKLGLEPAFLESNAYQVNWYESLIMSVLICMLPAILIAGSSLQKRLRFFPVFNSSIGYLLSIVILVLSIVSGFIAIGIGLYFAMNHYPEFARQVIEVLPV